jgi:hypothetical protein
MKLFKDALNNIFAYELDGSQDNLIGSKTPITEEEAAVIRDENAKKAFDALPYWAKRETEYPNIKEQLDTIFHNGLDAWKVQIQAIKDKYPKD